MNPTEAIQLMEFDLSKQASLESLKIQFKKMCLKWHPDRNKSPNANEMFIKIKEAYEVLQEYLKTRVEQKRVNRIVIDMDDMRKTNEYYQATSSSTVWFGTWSTNG